MTPTPAIKLPAIVTQAALDKLRAPDETHEVHIIVRRIVNQGPYTLRGRVRQYIITSDKRRGSHILRVPLSVWMAGCPTNTVVQNDSICYDITSTRNFTKSPLTFEMWKIGADAAEPEKVEDFQQPEIKQEADDAFRLILKELKAPKVALEAFEMARAGKDSEIGELLDKLKEDRKHQPKTAAERQRARRERLRAEKEAAEKNLAPA